VEVLTPIAELFGGSVDSQAGATQQVLPFAVIWGM